MADFGEISRAEPLQARNETQVLPGLLVLFDCRRLLSMAWIKSPILIIVGTQLLFTVGDLLVPFPVSEFRDFEDSCNRFEKKDLRI
jgi:hypothetical protein